MLNPHWWAKCLPEENGENAPLGLEEEQQQQQHHHHHHHHHPNNTNNSLTWQIQQIRPQKRKTILKACINSAFIILGAILIGLCVSLIERWPSWPRETTQSYHADFLRSISNTTLSLHLHELTKHPHVAGTKANFDTAEYVYSSFSNSGLQARYSDYEVLLTYPLERNLSLLHPNGSLAQYFRLQESPVAGDPFKDVIPSFHAYSPSGDVEGEIVYVNYGRHRDYELLQNMGVNITGSIVLARYGQIFRGDIVANAAKAGAKAAIIFSDPADYAGNASNQGYYPDSAWLPPSGVQRGTVFQNIGDPLTPGWPSTKNAERIPASQAGLPEIPSLPISADDARGILNTLAGRVAPKNWQGGLDLPVYKVGRGPGRLHFRYVANQTVAGIRNVLAVVKGYEEPDRIVLLGNHRDAWTFGAVDPNSGTAALLEIASRMGKLLRDGWKPRRTIVLCSWDAEEYGLVGSSEWVEQNVDLLGASAVAYLNVDCAVSGPGFIAAATPQLDDLLIDVTKAVKDPDSAHATLFDAWLAARNGSSSSLIDRLGDTGSDHAAFLQHAGVPAVDVYFGKSYPVYHSLYDNYNWMIKFGDPNFHRHVAVASVWGLMALRLADCLVLPFNYKTYASELQRYAKAVETALVQSKAPGNVSAGPLRAALAEFTGSAKHVSEESNELGKSLSGRDLSSYHLPRRAFNDKLMLVERAFLEIGGLPKRSWFKHLVYGPSKNNEYNTTFFPGILDTIVDASRSSSWQWDAAQHEIFRVSRVLRRAAVVMRGDLL